MKPYFIKERYNPQLGVYYVAMGQLSKAAAKRYERNTLYGDNVMLRFESEQEYKNKVAELQKSGERVHIYETRNLH